MWSCGPWMMSEVNSHALTLHASSKFNSKLSPKIYVRNEIMLINLLISNLKKSLTHSCLQKNWARCHSYHPISISDETPIYSSLCWAILLKKKLFSLSQFSPPNLLSMNEGNFNMIRCI